MCRRGQAALAAVLARQAASTTERGLVSGEGHLAIGVK
jgi:hypothetical protein